MKIKQHALTLALVLATADAFAPSARTAMPLNAAAIRTQSPFVALPSQQQNQHVMPTKLRMSDAAVAVEAQTEDDSEGATVPQLIFNLIKCIVGAGVLSLPAGIAAFASAPSAVVPAVALITAIGVLSGYGFALIGRCCAYTDSTSYREAWSKTISEQTSWIPAVAVTFKTCCAILAYSMILGDTFKSLLATAGFVGLSKATVTWTLTGTVLLPLCLLKNLAALAPFSLVGSLGMIYTAVAMTLRYLSGSYIVSSSKKVASGKFAADVAPALQQSFGNVGAKGILTPAAAILVGMLSTAYMSHFNAPKFYNELKEKTLPNYYKVVATSFAASIGIFAWVAAIGFLTFGASANGLILNNYSTKDSLMGFSRIAVAISLVFSYPLSFVGARDGIIDLAKLKATPKTENAITLGVLGLVTVGSLLIPDVSFVLALAGATLGNALIYVFPALMFRGAIKQKGADATSRQKKEVKFALLSAVAGIAMGILGATKAIQGLGN